MTSSIAHLRAKLERLQIEHEHLTDAEVVRLACSRCGWQAPPGPTATTAGGRPINARIWLAAALNAGGRYRATGHAADLRDGGPVIDSVILMAVVQRHFLRVPEPAWDDDALAGQLGVGSRDIARAQAVLDAVQAVVPRGRPVLGAGWWTRMPHGGLRAA
jgi:hypothetical protein